MMTTDCRNDSIVGMVSFGILFLGALSFWLWGADVICIAEILSQPCELIL